MYFLHAINSDRQTRLLNVLGQIAMILGDKKSIYLGRTGVKIHIMCHAAHRRWVMTRELIYSLNIKIRIIHSLNVLWFVFLHSFHFMFIYIIMNIKVFTVWAKIYNYGSYLASLCCFVFLFMCIFISYFIICAILSLLYLQVKFYSCLFVQYLFVLYLILCVSFGGL